MKRSIALILWIAAQVRTPDSAIVVGRLLSTEGMPVAGVRVIALETAYPRLNIAAQAATDKDGGYRLENLPSGEYFVVADPFNIPSYYPGTGNRDDSNPVAVTAGAVVKGIDFRLVRISGILRTVRTRTTGGSRYSGFLQDTQGRRLANFTVALSNADGKLWTATDTSGSFEFPSVRPGDSSIEAFGPTGELYEDLRIPVTLSADEVLEHHIGVRRLGDFAQRPDLYGPGDPRAKLLEFRRSGPGEQTFWRCQNPDSQVKPEYSEALRAADVRGSVAIQVYVDPNGKLVRLRVATPDANPDLALGAVKAVSQWKFTPLKFRSESSTRYVSCNGEGDVQDFQGTITFDSPPA
jgi:TonB family protein